jgi:integrase
MATMSIFVAALDHIADCDAEVLAGTYIQDSVLIAIGEAADAWLKHCRVRRDDGRRMERMTYIGYEI